MQNTQKSAGFSLIEIMIVVAIIGVLMAIAFPQYTSYVRRAQVTEATSGLSEMRVKMEQYFQDNRRYDGTPAACGVAGSSVAPLPTAKNFTFSCALALDTYTITATGNAGGQLASFKYSINQNNVRATLNLPSDWGAPNSTCWITSKGGTC
jgi:type IV pilus assembly protein PilE